MFSIQDSNITGTLTLVTDEPVHMHNNMFHNTGNSPCIEVKSMKDYLDCCNDNPTPIELPDFYKRACVKKQQETDMKATYISTNVNAVDNQDAQAREHLMQRAGILFYEKNNELRKQFNLDEEDYPYEAEDLIKRITEGRYTLDKSETFGNRIIWRDPKVKPDQEGYNVAHKALTEAYAKVKDDVIVLYPNEGLESLREFEKATFH